MDGRLPPLRVPEYQLPKAYLALQVKIVLAFLGLRVIQSNPGSRLHCGSQ